MKRFKEYLSLNEVFVIGDKKKLQGKNVVAFRQWIWVFEDEDFSEMYNNEMKKKLKISDDFDEFFDFESFVKDGGNEDLIVGTIEGRSLIIQVLGWRHSSASKTLEKLLKALKLQSVKIMSFDYNTEEDSEFEMSRDDFLKPLSKKVFYHGTSYKHLEKILKIGIKATGKTNFDDIVHEDKVFITLNMEKAHFHASTAASNHNSFPVIITMNIPDVSALVLDYDVAISIYGIGDERTIKLGYDEIHDFATRNAFNALTTAVSPFMKRQGKKLEDLNTKLGVFGYMGRIPANFFKKIILDEDSFREWYSYNILMGDEFEIKAGSLDTWYENSVKQFKDLKEEIEEAYNEEMEEREEEDEDF